MIKKPASVGATEKSADWRRKEDDLPGRPEAIRRLPRERAENERKMMMRVPLVLVSAILGFSASALAQTAAPKATAATKATTAPKATSKPQKQLAGPTVASS